MSEWLLMYLGLHLNDSIADHGGEAFKHFITHLIFSPRFYFSWDYLEAANTIRASECFQKAFELDARDGDAARRFAEGFAEGREGDLVEVIANRTIEGEGGFENSGSWPGVIYRLMHRHGKLLG